MYVRPSLCLSIYMSVRLSVSISVLPRLFLAIIHAPCNCMHHMRPQTMESDPLSGSIICPPVQSCGCPQDFCDFVFILSISVGVQLHDAFIHTLGSKGPQWGPVELICLYISPSVSTYLCISVSMSGCPHGFLEIICASNNCV